MYPKTGVTFEAWCGYALGKEWVIEKKEQLTLTQKGEETYVHILTNGKSAAYRRYEQAVYGAFDEQLMVRPSLKHIRHSFSNGLPAPHLMEWARKPNRVGMRARDHHVKTLNSLGYANEQLADSLVFQLVPELFLPSGESGEVTLEVRGVEKPLNLILTTPYPNKRYVVAGLLIGREVTHTGFYPLVLPKDQFPDTLEVELLWKIGGDEGYTLSHQLRIEFMKERMTGNFYTSHQQLVRSSEIPTLQVTSFMPEDAKLLKKREARFVGKMTWNHTLHETVKLYPVPMEMTRFRYTACDTPHG